MLKTGGTGVTLWYQRPGNWESGPSSAYYKAFMSVLTGKPYPIRVLNAACTTRSRRQGTRENSGGVRKLEFFFVMDIYHARM